MLFGKHPMAPAISPKKSWEGFAGSVTLQVVLGSVLFVYLLDGDWWEGAIVGALDAVTATLGDLVESVIKRDLGIKDMGNLLPGHGGLHGPARLRCSRTRVGRLHAVRRSPSAGSA